VKKFTNRSLKLTILVLIIEINHLSLNICRYNLFLNEMTINRNVFDLSMKDKI